MVGLRPLLDQCEDKTSGCTAGGRDLDALKDVILKTKANLLEETVS